MAPGHSPCASCKLLRRRCTKDCIFAPYFPPHEPHKFAIVHKVFGASNVSKMLQDLQVHQRGDAVISLVYEANARMKDPVYGCVGAISYLQKEVSQLKMQLAMAQAEILYIQMQQKPFANAPAPTSVVNGMIPVHDHAHTSVLTDDVVSRASSDDTSYPYLHNMFTNRHQDNIDQYFNFTYNKLCQYDNLKRESSSLWT